MEHRELKFRAWDGSKMHSVNDAANELWPVVLVSDAQLEDEGGLKAYRRSWSVMQFTGMKDMNGVDVYEGDIIRAYQLVGQVAYHNIRGAFIFADTKHLNEMLYQVMANTMVIGNIHEHPHLLSGGN